MISLIAGALLLILALYGLKTWTRADPKVLVAILMRSLAYAALLGAAGALVMGRFTAAIPLAAVGIALLGRLDPQGVGGYLGSLFRKRGAPQVSKVRTALLEMELDLSSGDMRGQVLAGPYAGTALDALDVPSLLALRRICDAQSLSLLEAYLDRRAPAWREHAQADAGAGGMGDAGGSAGRDAMTEEEAYEILGLQPGAEAEAVRAAHRALMKKLHPDLGGSSYLAARINRAKDVILRKHG
ncbi:molecular chaperone DnaJ [Xanthobacter autotrophicus]|uniref:DnaJ domain-containing protein n=1 Tax=Xanthobacter TaxID=279 RepID=UPI0024AB33A0|nr:DnaJ domain-containing protein [Xanthobacter autotrophicus]MDI4663273.1 molecular chaperone DnaJ [Xanthobacter autotrophicus]